MSDAPVEPQAGHDPLTALRTADSRPLLVQLRDRGRSELHSMLAQGPAILLIVATGVVLVFVTWRLAIDGQPPIEDSIPLAATPAPAAAASVPPDADADADAEGEVLVVHVAGAVHEPGLVTGTTGWRVADAIATAGGFTPSADPDRLNLARLIGDGERVYVPAEGEPIPSTIATGAAIGGSGGDGPIDLNTASASELELLPGVGPSTAAAIIDHRETHGSFGTIDALVAVRGIGPATLERLRPHVAVG